MTNKEKLKTHLENVVIGQDIVIKTYKQMLVNLEDIRHYKNIDKRFLTKIMLNVPKDKQGYDIMNITTKYDYQGRLDLNIWGKHRYEIERKPNQFEREHEPEKIFFNSTYIDLGGCLWLSGDNSNDYKPEDDTITRLEKVLKSLIDYKTTQKEKTLFTLDTLEEELKKVKEFKELVEKAEKIRNNFSYDFRNCVNRSLGYDQTILDKPQYTDILNQLDN